jgi:hypothetical protein
MMRTTAAMLQQRQQRMAVGQQGLRRMTLTVFLSEGVR